MPICAVYLLASYRHGTLYLGHTTDLALRIYRHKTGFDTRGFSHRYRTYYLVYYELASDAHEAYIREQKLKGANRKKKIRLIERLNPDWRDLSLELV